MMAQIKKIKIDSGSTQSTLVTLEIKSEAPKAIPIIKPIKPITLANLFWSFLAWYIAMILIYVKTIVPQILLISTIQPINTLPKKSMTKARPTIKIIAFTWLSFLSCFFKNDGNTSFLAMVLIKPAKP